MKGIVIALGMGALIIVASLLVVKSGWRTPGVAIDAALPPESPTPEANVISDVLAELKEEPATPVAEPDKPDRKKLNPSAGSPLALELNSRRGDVEQDLESLYRIMLQFGVAVRGHAVIPWGTNEELTRLLTGDNPTGLAFIPKHHRAVSTGGELVDRWGTPYFFHKISSDRTDIRSAGPDGRMWTEDDEQYPRPRPAQEDRAAAGHP